MKKILALVACLSLVASLAIGGSIAYLTDRDSRANIFTIGNVEIELREDFADGATLIPGQEINKEPYIVNTGKNDAWVWATYAIPAALNEYIEIVPHGDSEQWDLLSDKKEVKIDNKDYVLYTALYKDILYVNEHTGRLFQGVKFDETIDIDTTGKLHSVENGVATPIDWNYNESKPTIYVSAYAIQTEGFEDDDNGPGYKKAYAAYNDQWGTNYDEGGAGVEYGTPSTVVNSVDELLEALATPGSNVASGFHVVLPGQNGNPAAPSRDMGVLLNGGTLSGGGHGFNVEEGSNAYVIVTTGGTITNVDIRSGGRGIVTYKPTEDVIIDRINIDGPGYAINTSTKTDKEGLKLIVRNSDLHGWSSWDGGFESATFENTYFGWNRAEINYKNNPDLQETYGKNLDALMRPYITTTFDSCAFEKGFVLDLSELKDGQTLTFNNCQIVTHDADTGEYLGAVPLTDDNFADLLLKGDNAGKLDRITVSYTNE